MVAELSSTEENLSGLSADELVERAVAINEEIGVKYKVLGKIVHYLKIQYGEPGRGGFHKWHKGPTVTRTLLARGVPYGTLKQGRLASVAYAAVIEGKLTEEEYERMPYAEVEARFRAHGCGGARRDLMTRRIAGENAPRIIASSQSDNIVSELLEDVPKDMDHLRRCLTHAQDWLIEARACFTTDTPEWWDDRIAGALKHIGDLRFVTNEHKHPLARKTR